MCDTVFLFLCCSSAAVFESIIITQYLQRRRARNSVEVRLLELKNTLGQVLDRHWGHTCGKGGFSWITIFRFHTRCKGGFSLITIFRYLNAWPYLIEFTYHARESGRLIHLGRFILLIPSHPNLIELLLQLCINLKEIWVAGWLGKFMHCAWAQNESRTQATSSVRCSLLRLDDKPDL